MIKKRLSGIFSILTVLLFVGAAVTAIVLIFFFPPVKGLAYQTFLGTLKRQWLPLHKVLGFALIVVALLSLILDWNNFAEKAKNIFRKNELEEIEEIKEE